MNKEYTSKKIGIVFRKKSTTAFSIEELFSNILNNISPEVQSRTEIIYLKNFNFGIKKKFKNLKDIFSRRSQWLHITGEVYYTAIFNKKLILTIHDIASAETGNFLKRYVIGLFWFKIPCRNAKYITVISEESKKRLVEYTGVNSKKVHVIHNPVSPILKKTKPVNNEKPHILFIGWKPNKNLTRTILALKGLDVRLHIIGKLSDQQKQFLKEAGTDYSNSFNLNYSQVVEEYIKSDFLLFPSTYEGFGLPIVEAQAIGRPVITSNISSMPEVAGEGAYFVNPYKVDEIRNAVVKLLNDKELRLNLVERGLENVKRFEVASIAKKYEDLYKKVLDEES